MEIYLLKSTACMGIFLVFYKLLLEKESMHHFKRFFLLTALIFSLIIPQIVFTEYIEAEPTPAVTQVLTINEQPEITPIVHEMKESPMNWSLILYTIYGLGVAIFGFRFLYNIAKLWIRVRRNTQIKFNFLVKVLLKEELPPHTFLRYIFLNKQKFESKSIPAAVLLHEETHAKEWHSLDVIFIELLQVLFWFNPLIYLFKRSIKLNHEFLADSAVIKVQENQLHYQNTLLSYLSNDNFHTHQSVGIANAINYSSIKKRFIIMKKQTSKRGILIRSLLILPVLTIMLYSFSNRKEKFISDTQAYPINGEWLNEENELEILKITAENENLLSGNYQNNILKFEKINGQFYYSEFDKEKLLVKTNQEEKTIQFNGKKFIRKKNSLRNQLNGKWLSEQNNIKLIVSEYDIYMVFDLIEGKKKAVRYYPKKRSNSYYFTYGYEDWSFKIENNKLVDSRGNYYNRLRENEQSTIPKITVNINKEGQLLVQDELVELEDLQKHLSEINSHLTINQRKQIVKTIIKVVPDSPKEVVMKVEQELLAYGAATIDIQEYNPKIDKRKKRATSVQMSKYDELAKKYNRMIADGGNIRIVKSDVDQLKYIYELMSKEQKENAEPFPDFPEPPPAPKAPKAPNSSDYADNQIKEIIENQDPYNHLNLNINGIKGTSSKTTMELTSPTAPTPPTPPSPLDYAIDMAKKGAIFYLEGEKITSDKAIDILKKNKELNMESRKKLGKTEVRITTAPVTIR
ncbi:M56 family metallopeptidase [Maribacter sp. M208]|uniref:M56 family metallopeptidase n=1 Tax=Maribacter huludaoensis TaxID=3030010 RepID=UPI0023EE21B9|nr:M56 family metallopeptidase [Maribacter huludaoensis]MDF4221215.1 M56 family metallopeptidase [Maribacter huludaoensis]